MTLTIFDILKNVLWTKQKDIFKDIENESQFSPYMLNRWLSMYSNKLILSCSQLNKYSNTYSEKKQTLKLFQAVISKFPIKRIIYIKKVKESKEKEIENLGLIAHNMELSQREIKNYLHETV